MIGLRTTILLTVCSGPFKVGLTVDVMNDIKVVPSAVASGHAATARGSIWNAASSAWVRTSDAWSACPQVTTDDRDGFDRQHLGLRGVR